MGNCCYVKSGVAMIPHPLLYSMGRDVGCLAQRENKSLAVVGCPVWFANKTLRDECASGRGRYTADEPVTDVATGVVYRNRHCAQCHEVTTPTPWPLHIVCIHFQVTFCFLYILVIV